MPQPGIKDIIDILLIAFILYGFFQLLRRSGAGNIFWLVSLFIVSGFIVTDVLRLELTGALFSRVISIGALALIVIFQEELRGFIYRVGARMNIKGIRNRFLPTDEKQSEQYVSQLVLACSNMSKQKTGALIILEGDISLREYIDTGEPLDAAVSARLIENIFFKNTPLHDGALILSHGRLVAAACLLPISKDANIPQHYGLRHRAALGVAEKSDALVVVVSEETGKISVAKGGRIYETAENDLTQIITQFVDK